MDIKRLQTTITPFLNGRFELPKPTKQGNELIHIVGVSSGIDSTATALVLKALYPETKFLYVFTPVGDWEADGTDEALNKLSSFLDAKITRVSSRLGMIDHIDKAGGFLPSQRQRWCTSTMKILPMQRYMNFLRKQYGSSLEFAQYTGIRADEPTRQGAQYMDGDITNYFPLQALGLDKTAVNSIVQQTIGIPLYYLEKTRSGCSVCPFSRKSEVIATIHREPPRLQQAADLEVMPDNVISIYNNLPTPVSVDTSISRGMLAFVRPDWLGYKKMGYQGSRGKAKKAPTIDMFSQNSKHLFVAVEYSYCDAFRFMDPVYTEQVITYSTSLGGLKTALKHFWLHRLQTKELHDIATDAALENEKQIAIIQIEVYDYDRMIPKKPEDTYTWQNDKTPLIAIRKAIAIIQHILLVEGLKQEDNPAIEKVRKFHGEVLNFQRYTPPARSELIDDIDIEDAPIICNTCSR